MTTSKELLEYYRGNFHSADQNTLKHLNSQAQYSHINPALKIWRPGEAGDKKIRFLPVTLPTPPEGISWGFKACVYYGVLSDRSSVASPTMFDPDARDPFGEVLDKLIRQYPKAKDSLYAHRSWRWATYIIDRKVPGEPMAWLLPKRVFEVLYSTAKETAETGMASFDDLFAGRDFNLKFVKTGSEARNASYEGMTFSLVQTPVVNTDEKIAQLITWIMEHPIHDQFVRLPDDVTNSLAERFENLLKAEILGGVEDLSDQDKELSGIEKNLASKASASSFRNYAPEVRNQSFGPPIGGPRAAPVFSSVPMGERVKLDSPPTASIEMSAFLEKENLEKMIKEYGINTEGMSPLEIIQVCMQHTLRDEETAAMQGKHA
jgi:hypothetical protein